MLTLGNLLLFLLLASLGAWFWHAHGIRERALQAVRQYCAKADVDLLDENVAFRRLALLPDLRGRKRLARVYGFEFTVTGEQRHPGSIVMFGTQVGHIELAPHPFRPSSRAEPVVSIVPEPAPRHTPSQPGMGQVIQLDDWRRRRDERRSKSE